MPTTPRPTPTQTAGRSIEALAYEAFRTGTVTPEISAWANAEIDLRGIRHIVDEVEARIERAHAAARAFKARAA